MKRARDSSYDSSKAFMLQDARQMDNRFNINSTKRHNTTFFPKVDKDNLAAKNFQTATKFINTKIPRKATVTSKQTRSINTVMCNVLKVHDQIVSVTSKTDKAHDIRGEFNNLIREEKKILALHKNLVIQQGGGNAELRPGLNRIEAMEAIPVYFQADL